MDSKKSVKLEVATAGGLADEPEGPAVDEEDVATGVEADAVVASTKDAGELLIVYEIRGGQPTFRSTAVRYPFALLVFLTVLGKVGIVEVLLE